MQVLSDYDEARLRRNSQLIMAMYRCLDTRQPQHVEVDGQEVVVRLARE